MKISELMDNYTDNEFLINGEQKADAEKVLQAVREKAKPKKHMKLRTKLIVAIAAAVVGVSVVTASTLPNTVLVSRTGWVNEWGVFGSLSHTDAATEVDPYKVINGRVYFTAVDEGEEAIDITDTVCSGKAFIYEYKQKDSRGNEHTCLIAVGGDPDNMGYAEAKFGTGTSGNGCSSHIKYGWELFYWIDGKAVAEKELTDEQRKHIGEYPKNWVDKPWTFEFRAAELRLEGKSEEDIENILEEEREKNNEYYYSPRIGTGIVEPFVPEGAMNG